MRAVIVALYITLYSVPLWAKSIDTQIEAIQKAPVKERFKLMNALKKRLVRMKEKERIEALSQLRSSTKSKSAKKAIEKVEKDTKRISREHLENEMESHIENEVEENNADHKGGDDD
ncbi:hypothetical protein [Sulfurovum sp.]|uniref:hypothetical protein n=1 Tax=Sulfurovum sp. TaxID=1969726 RepID=UPI0025CE2D8F|nr:hypothetical protein [Sulfurovum sp.]